MSTPLLLITVIFAAAVEMVEATTVVLAVGVSRGWRPSLQGAVAALVVLAAAVAIFGPALIHLVPIDALRVIVGTLLLIMGLQWLRKALLRASGYLRQRDEAAIFAHERSALAIGTRSGSFDGTAFAVSFKGVFLEGLEVVMIVISFGASTGNLGTASLGAGIAALVVGMLGLALARPLAAVPENALKLLVSLLLTSFGTFWIGEGMGVGWPGVDWAIVWLLGIYAAAALVMVSALKRRSRGVQAHEPRLQEAQGQESSV